jgi:quinol monooxygenase YgiN
MIYVVASIQVNEGQLEAYLAAFKALIPTVLAEEGCVEYSPALDIESGLGELQTKTPNGLTVLERWTSLEALHAHLATPHMTAFFEETSSMVADIKASVLEAV